MRDERTVVVKVRRWGNCLAMVLPEEIAAQEGILAEDVLVVKLRKRRFKEARAGNPLPPKA